MTPLTVDEVQWLMLQMKKMMWERAEADRQWMLYKKELADLRQRKIDNGWNDTTYDYVCSQTRAYTEAIADLMFFRDAAGSRASSMMAVLAVHDALNDSDLVPPHVLTEALARIEARKG